jgi:hypothetical protein
VNREVLSAVRACAAALLLASALSPVPGHSFFQGVAAGSRATIDGRRFHREESGVDDYALLKSAFERSGVDPPGDFDAPSGEALHPEIFAGRIVEEPASPSSPAIPAPAGLIPDRSMQLESGSGPVRLLIGRMEHRGASVRTRLVAEGWSLIGTGHEPGPVRLLTKATGKEKAIVCLDEAEGAFLLFGERRR